MFLNQGIIIIFINNLNKSFIHGERQIHDKPKTAIAPGRYTFTPIITNEGEKFSMRSSRPVLPSSETWFVPGPKYPVGDSHRFKPAYFK